jgi:hypothetical protein
MVTLNFELRACVPQVGNKSNLAVGIKSWTHGQPRAPFAGQFSADQSSTGEIAKQFA